MTATNKFHLIPLKTIVVGDRVRDNLGNIESLAQSMKNFGLMHPLVVQKKGKKFELIAGGRRLAAAHQLGWKEIACHFFEDLSKEEVKILELEENLKRQDLAWDEECFALRTLHSLKVEQDKNWTMEKTAELLSISQEWVSKRITVANALDTEDKTITGAQGANAAYNVLQRKSRRALDDAVAEVTEIEDSIGEEPGTETAPSGTFKVEEASFLTWESNKKFNLIHCDFPYGIKHGKSAQGKAGSWDTPYEDSPDVYWELLYWLCHAVNVADSAHMIFWFSMNFYEETVKVLTVNGGWKVDPFPLIWYKSDNHGILPDPNRGPRRVYETALLCSRGDRKIVRPVSNLIGVPVGQKQHLSEKPEEVVRHFLRMLCDDHSTVLDPTCGSGTALAAAKTLGAKYVQGLDIDPDSVALANRNLKSAALGEGHPTGDDSTFDLSGLDLGGDLDTPA